MNSIKLFASSLVLGALLFPKIVSAQSANQSSSYFLFSMDRQPLSRALVEFAKNTQLTVVAPSTLTAEKTAHALYGYLTATDALEKLLLNTALGAQIDNNGVISLVAKKPLQIEKTYQNDASARAWEETYEKKIIEEVVIRGHISDPQTMQQFKHSKHTIANLLTNEMLEKQASVNLVESLILVSGAAISRDSGEGRQLFLRGLPAHFINTQINGLDVLFTSDSGIVQRGGAARSRGFDFNLFPPTMFDAVVVSKSSDAKNSESGVAGNVNLLSANPLDNPKESSSGDLGIVLKNNSLDNRLTPSIAFSGDKRWNSLAFSAGLQYADINSVEHGFHNWRWSKSNFSEHTIENSISDETADRLVNADGEDRVFIPEGNSISAWGNSRQRLSAVADLAWQVSSESYFLLSGLFGRTTNTRSHFQLATAGTNGLRPNIIGTQKLSDAIINKDSLVFASFSNIDLRTEHQRQRSDTNYCQISSKLKHRFSPRFSSEITVGQSKSVFEVPKNEKIFLEATNKSLTIDWREPEGAEFSYGFSINDPNNWQLMRSDVREDRIANTHNTVKLDSEFLLSETAAFEVGGQLKRFVSNGWERRSSVNWLLESRSPDLLFTVTDLPLQQAYVVAQHSATFASIETTGIQHRDLSESDVRLGTDYRLKENTESAYAQLISQHSLFERLITSQIGLKYFKTKQAARGTFSDQLGVGQTNNEVKVDYDFWLPSFNLKLDIDEAWILRAAFSKSVARANINEIKPTADLNVADAFIQLGNPALRPVEVVSTDLYLDYMSSHVSFEINIFNKSLRHFITQRSFTTEYVSTGLPTALLESDTRLTPQSEFTVSSPINGGTTSIKGIEMAASWSLPAPFTAFTVSGNFSLNSGSTPIVKNQEALEIQVPGLSKNVINGALEYSFDDWRLQILGSYRSSYIRQIGQTQNTSEGFDDMLFWDFRADYDVSPALSLSFIARNLTDEALKQFQDTRPLIYLRSGRQFFAGFELHL
ncbi:TonB-dependent receptor [Paraglaciecola agarilytica]|uniref:TonB-dependent receptor n=1 Tax=Paraglaciecola chathamensis TaxID=368405 RepID=UPI001C087D19|nr:TonB-dependent receptor [Paraglaciecola agarilytica]MBU3016764.1 TonB-dependent receptor [Paraglaciecola agarilytica]